MKKLITIISSITLIATASLSTISCRSQVIQGKKGHRAIFLTGGVPLKGSAFNENAYGGLKDWGDEVGENLTNNFLTPTDILTPTLNSNYLLAKSQKADAIVLNGNVFDVSIGSASKIMKDKTILWIDGNPTNLANIISIQFKSELSGFKAGFNSIEYLYKNREQMLGNKQDISFGLFGGMDIKFGVNNYMWGFLTGIRTWIEMQDNKETLLNQIKIVNEGKGWNFKGDTQRWFSGDFDANSISADTIIKTLQTADVIFPVAGPQISQTLSLGYNKYVVGVDDDQVEDYLKYKDKFLTSAMKDVHKAVFDELKHSSSLTDVDGNHYNNGFHDGTTQSDPTWSSIGTSENNIIKSGDWDIDVENNWTMIADTVISRYAASGNSFQDYMNGEYISSVAQEIATKIIKK